MRPWAAQFITKNSMNPKKVMYSDFPTDLERNGKPEP